MARFQKTLEAPVSLRGLGVHSGRDASVRLVPASEDGYDGTVSLESGGTDWHVVITPPGETWKLRGRWNPLKKPRISLPTD